MNNDPYLQEPTFGHDRGDVAYEAVSSSLPELHLTRMNLLCQCLSSQALDIIDTDV